jgi:RNA polymerase sigma-70 factor (ECF subfamily)
MCSDSRSHPEQLITQVRQGSEESLGKLLQLYRNYLNLLARTQIDLHLQGRASASDLVQETVLEAYHDFGQFRGKSEVELLAWLRRILVHNVFQFIKKHAIAKKRDVRREVPLHGRLAALDRSTADVEAALISQWSSPSARALRRERAAILADLLAELPPQYRDVIVLRDLEELPFAEVASRLGRSPAAARRLWLRAVGRLRQLLEREDLL